MDRMLALFPKLIRELIINLLAQFSQVHVHGVFFTISPSLINQFLGLSVPNDLVINYLSSGQVAIKLTGGIVYSWPTNCQLPAVSLSIKYVILHKIGIANWIPSTHASTISTALGHFIYLIDARSKINVGEFMFWHLRRHLDTFGINILNCFPHLLSAFLLTQHPSILSAINVASP